MTAYPVDQVFSKGLIVDLAASMAGATGSLAGTSNFDKNTALRHLEFIILELEGCRSIFLGYKKSQFQEPQPEQDSGLKGIHIYPVATLLAYRAGEVFGIDITTKQLLVKSYNEAINLLTPIVNMPEQVNEQLPVGAGFDKYNTQAFKERQDAIEITNDSILDLGHLVPLEPEPPD